jgi:hypothetical protein
MDFLRAYDACDDLGCYVLWLGQQVVLSWSPQEQLWSARFMLTSCQVMLAKCERVVIEGLENTLEPCVEVCHPKVLYIARTPVRDQQGITRQNPERDPSRPSASWGHRLGLCEPTSWMAPTYETERQMCCRRAGYWYGYARSLFILVNII